MYFCIFTKIPVYALQKYFFLAASELKYSSADPDPAAVESDNESTQHIHTSHY